MDSVATVILAATVALMNSVANLYSVLSEAKYTVEGSTRQRLASAFGVSPDDQLAFFHGFAQLFQLLNEAETQMSNLVTLRTLEPNDYLPPFIRIREALTLMSKNVEAPWTERRDSIQDVDLTTLRICADFIPSTEQEDVIPADQLAKIASDIDELTEDVVDSNIDRELREIIVNHLQESKRAIVDYRIRGAVRIREAGIFGLGTSILIANQISIDQRNGKAVEADVETKLRKYWAIVNTLLTLASSALKAQPVLEGALKALPLLLGSGSH